MGKLPVIFITFRDVKEMEWGTCLEKIKRIIQDEYSKHYYLLKSKELIPHERDFFKHIIRGETIEKAVDENIVLKDVNNDEDVLWSFLLMGG
jgi:hypothetical protein